MLFKWVLINNLQKGIKPLLFLSSLFWGNIQSHNGQEHNFSLELKDKQEKFMK